METRNSIPGWSLLNEARRPTSSRPKLHGYVGLARYEWDLLRISQRDGPIESFSVRYVVPPAPKRTTGHAVFLFSGMQPSGASTERRILQPVLQWGPSAAGGGDYWSICSWQVQVNEGESQPQVLTSKRTLVEVGTSLEAVISQHVNADGTYSQLCEFSGFDTTRLSVRSSTELAVCGLALEVMNVTTCQQLPATQEFSFFDANLRSSNGRIVNNWQIGVVQNPCGITMDVRPHGDLEDEVRIRFANH